ncbi:MAG: high-potential iron-sulfur protein [Arenicellales bacterium]
MTHTTNRATRRRFLKTAALSAVIAPLGARLIDRPAHAASGAELPPLDPATNPTAAALGYVDDASQADAAKHPNYKKGDSCSNCNFYTGETGAERGGCTIFPQNSVSAKGWCASHTPKA